MLKALIENTCDLFGGTSGKLAQTVARESANVVLIGNDLSKLVETLSIARRCHRTIMQNFVGTLVVDAVIKSGMERGVAHGYDKLAEYLASVA